MDTTAIINGLLSYLCLIIVITLHEFAHAWTAWKCGDDTARLQGRVSLNPIDHMDPIGTVALPLLAFALAASNSALASFIIGWGRPVPVNPANLSRRRLHDSLIAGAGPAMNVVIAMAAVMIARLFDLGGQVSLGEAAIHLAIISLFLCFFNLLPIPPLDGSHFLRHAIGMTDERYYACARFGFVVVILLIQLPFVQWLLSAATFGTLDAMAWVVGFK